MTAPSAENLQTVFEFLVKGLSVLKYSVGDVMIVMNCVLSFDDVLSCVK